MAQKVTKKVTKKRVKKNVERGQAQAPQFKWAQAESM